MTWVNYEHCETKTNMKTIGPQSAFARGRVGSDCGMCSMGSSAHFHTDSDKFDQTWHFEHQVLAGRPGILF